MLLVAEIALDALAVLSSGIAHKKQKPHDNFSVWFYRGCRKGQVTVNIVPFFFYTSIPVWVLFRVWIGSLKQTYSVCPATYDVF